MKIDATAFILERLASGPGRQATIRAPVKIWNKEWALKRVAG